MRTVLLILFSISFILFVVFSHFELKYKMEKELFKARICNNLMIGSILFEVVILLIALVLFIFI